MTAVGAQPARGNHNVAGRKNTWRRVKDSPDARHGLLCLVGFTVLDVMTGQAGSSTAPLSGVTGSLSHPVRDLVFLAMAAVIWGAITLRDHHGRRFKRWSDRANSLPSRILPNRRARYGAYAALLAVAIIYPQFAGPFWQNVLVDQIGIYVLLALGLNVVVGFAGLLDLGYIAFYAIGAYSAAFWSGALPVHPPLVLNDFWIIPIAIATAMMAGVILGTPTLRLRGDYLAIVTLAFGELIEDVAVNLNSITGGSTGVTSVIPHPSINLLGISYHWTLSDLPYYYLLLTFVVIVLFAFSSLENSRVGRAWTAIREDEVAAESNGINVLKYKVMAFAIGASTSGFAGVLTATQIQFINPQDFIYYYSIVVLVLVIFGGMGSLPGAVVGAAVLQWLPQLLNEHAQAIGYQQQDQYMYLGAVLILMMIFRPVGIIPSRRRRREIGLAEQGVGSADAMSASGGPVA